MPRSHGSTPRSCFVLDCIKTGQSLVRVIEGVLTVVVTLVYVIQQRSGFSSVGRNRTRTPPRVARFSRGVYGERETRGKGLAQVLTSADFL